MIVVVGEILVDLFDSYQRIGGAPFNFAFHLRQLGMAVRLVTRIGKDAHGHEIRAMLTRNGFDLEDLQVDDSRPTGTVRVTLDGAGVPRFDIREDVAYDCIDLGAVGAISGPDVHMVYFGTLAQRSDTAFRRFDNFLSGSRGSAKTFCDINLRPPHVRRDVVEAALRHADILKLNTDELSFIGEMLNHPGPEAELVAHLMQRHAVEMVVLTRGASGSTIFTAEDRIDAPPVDSGRVVDTVGAGDALAAVIAAGFLIDLPLADTLTAASRFAARICGLPGAIPDDLSIYADLRARLRKKTEGTAYD